MFLKRIILHGFKSFADRTEFDFGEGITTIVGPNGCGKSNVLDAVRWVLGEQSARSLRGGKMSDVIFAGSRSRKPANFAEVQLAFDNRGGILRSDDEEVVVGRQLYRSGESGYRLNGKSCRLKDIRELLLDTGVGVDAYSVIEQGRVDLLLQASPIERREIFEEAAGISRYKVRRIEAQRKLERTDNNLLRLRDIIDELERQLRSVRLAAGKARNFQQYDARLRELRSSFSMAEYHELERGRLTVRREADRFVARLQEVRAGLADHDAEVAELQHTRQALDEQIQAADAELLQVQTLLSTLAERIAQSERRLPELAAAGDRRRQQAAEVAERLEAQRERMAAAEQALRELLESEQRSAAMVSELTAGRDAAEAQASAARQALEREKVAAFEAVRRSALLQNEHENLSQQHGRLGAQAQRLRERRQALEQECQKVQRELDGLAGRISELDRRLADLSAELRTDEGQLEQLGAEASQLDQEIGQTKEARSAATSRLALLEDMERRLDGVDQGTRAVLTWQKEDPSRNVVVGLVADLLRIDDPRVALLQPILSTFEDHVVVRDTPALLAELELRGLLAESLRVVALDRQDSALTPISYSHAPGYVARATDWVTCAPAHRALAEHLLGRTFVVEDLRQALDLARQALAGCCFVTLNGEMVTADGRLAFGSAAAAKGLISRKAEIRQLRAELEGLEDRLVNLTRRRIEVDQAVSDLQLRRDGMLERIATGQREHAEARNTQARLEDGRQRLGREANTLGEELAGVEQSVEEIVERLRALAAESDSSGAAQREHESRIAALADELKGCEGELARLAREVTAAQIESGRIVEKRSAGEAALDELRARQAALERGREEAEREAGDTANQIKAVEAELRAAREQQAGQRGECDRRREEALRLRESRQDLHGRLEECGAAARELQQRIEALEADLHERQVALREAEVRKEGLIARVRDELALDLAELYADYEHSEQDWEAIRAEIEEVRGKIARLGHVNLDAIAELEELTPRHEHLVRQRDDLTRASERLQALIEELDRESRTRFASALEQIRVNFQEMFRKLFGGGKADIVLEDPEQPLECGIEIIARPPGKEPRSISLLSGGEKTLTAVALLMGVFRSRPSPFAILDEVDAALDESNVERFNTVLQEFLSHSQFVVITHSKRTMACADVLYGVTMEEPGVSKRVSVRFEDRVQTPIVA